MSVARVEVPDVYTRNEISNINKNSGAGRAPYEWFVVPAPPRNLRCLSGTLTPETVDRRWETLPRDSGPIQLRRCDMANGQCTLHYHHRPAGCHVVVPPARASSRAPDNLCETTLKLRRPTEQRRRSNRRRIRRRRRSSTRCAITSEPDQPREQTSRLFSSRSARATDVCGRAGGVPPLVIASAEWTQRVERTLVPDSVTCSRPGRRPSLPRACATRRWAASTWWRSRSRSSRSQRSSREDLWFDMVHGLDDPEDVDVGDPLPPGRVKTRARGTCARERARNVCAEQDVCDDVCVSVCARTASPNGSHMGT